MVMSVKKKKTVKEKSRDKTGLSEMKEVEEVEFT